MIEAITYRLSDHTTADDARRYRDDTEVSAHWHEEPIARLRQYLVSQGVWNRDDEEKALALAAAEIDRAAQEYIATPPQPVTAMFDYLFAELPASLVAQRAQVIAEAADDA
jgi:pyruvate dehydrogenase E1 component alpha subunit